MAGSRGFSFKQFHINHDHCAMKVGTDSILLGAWVPLVGAKRVLDIGTGSGLLALMVAQRSGDDCQIDGIELDENAAQQAQQNVAASPWAKRIQIIQGAVQNYQSERYDLILSNPPYFQANHQITDRARAQARHTDSLSSEDLLAASDRLLNAQGQLALVLPHSIADEIISIAKCFDLQLICYTEVLTKQEKGANRVLLLLGRGLNRCKREEIVIHSADGGYSDRYIQLTSAFYLKM